MNSDMYEYYDKNGRKITVPTYDSRTGQPLSGRYEQVPLGYDAPASCPNPISTNTSQDELLWKKIEAARIELQKNEEKNRQAIEKQVALEKIKTAGEQKRAEIRSDVAAKAALHNEEVVILRDGRVTVRKERFDGYVEKFAPFRVVGSPVIYFCAKADEKILSAVIALESGREIEFLISQSRLTSNKISTTLNQIGVTFNMGRKKESELRGKFVTALVACAQMEELPFCHGWNKTDSGWDYLTHKVVDDFHFLLFLTVHFLHFAYHNPADQPVQHGFVQFLNR